MMPKRPSGNVPSPSDAVPGTSDSRKRSMPSNAVPGTSGQPRPKEKALPSVAVPATSGSPLPKAAFNPRKRRRPSSLSSSNIGSKGSPKRKVKVMLPSPPCMTTPGGTELITGDPLLHSETDSTRIRPLVPEGTPTVASPMLSSASASSGHEVAGRKPRLALRGDKVQCRRSLNRDLEFLDSGSEYDSGSDEENISIIKLRKFRYNVKRDQEEVVERDEDVESTFDNLGEVSYHEDVGDDDRAIYDQEICEGNYEVVKDVDIIDERAIDLDVNVGVDKIEDLDESVEAVHENVEGEEGNSGAAAAVDTDFFWSEDFTSFTGQKETYLRVPGPTFSSQEPVEIFCAIWDLEFMETVVKETNRYAWNFISNFTDPENEDRMPEYLSTWFEVTVDEMYRYFSMLILMTFCHRSKLQDYWSMGLLGMPDFRCIMSRNRFLLISKFLHFVNNANLESSSYLRKLGKIVPVLDHCNRKFAELYTPAQHLSLDESLLLWKGRLSFRQCIRSKAARFGLKSFDLCEAETGYLLQHRWYTGKEVAMHPGSLHGFKDKTAKIVLDLMERYMDLGHVLVMDSWYNQLPLARYLKGRRTDVLGTLNRRQTGVPQSIKDLSPKQMERGQSVASHSGDLAVVAWNDLKLVTVISTYHQHEMVPGQRGGQAIMKPIAVQEYNRYMGGVDLKDHKLSLYLLERKRNQKWYIKIFKRLLNESLLNSFIIYTRNPMTRSFSHRDFRMKVAEGLLSRFPREVQVPRGPSQPQLLRLIPGKHIPVNTEASDGRKKKQLRCVRCTALKKRTMVTAMCKLCQVPLCLGDCWEDYHYVENLHG